jgi:hypothetical protein
MNFKNFKKYSGFNHMIATIVLIILLTQSKTFDFLTETYLGRLVLLTFVLFISYCNQMAGLFAVLCVIISYNYYDMYKVNSYNYKHYENNSYYEGFDVSRNNVNTMDMSGNRIASGNMSENRIASGNMSENRIAERDVSGNKEDATSLTSLNNSDSEKKTEKISSRFEGKEGFCIPERELNILRGKQSNSIPVMNIRNKYHTEPSDKSSFISDFAIF